MAKLHLSQIDYDQAPSLDLFEDRTIFQTNDWLKFISHSQTAEPVIAQVKEKHRQVGRFTALVIKKCGLRILGSPFRGWTTSYMGFNLEPSISRTDALLALKDFAFRDLKCIHVEVMDRRLTPDDFQQAGYKYIIMSGFEIDLTKDDDKLFEAMKPACRRCIRKSTKVGVQVEEAKDLYFVDDYYNQLRDVFAKQKLVPTYTKERVRALVELLLPTGQLLLVRARNNKGECIATGIFPAFNDTMYFWGGASWRVWQHLRPNEAVQWFAMRYWKAKGISKYDMGGSGEYKRKYGGDQLAVPWGRKSKYAVFENLRSVARNLHVIKQTALGFRKC